MFFKRLQLSLNSHVWRLLTQVLCVPKEEPDGSSTMSAKISDFGLALRAMPLVTGRGWGTVWTPPRGTPLYMAPEMFAPRDARGFVQVSLRDSVVGAS